MTGTLFVPSCKPTPRYCFFFCKYTAEPSLRVSMWLSIVSARAFPNVPPRGIPTMASRSPKPSPTSTRWEHILKHSLTPNSCKMWEFFTMNPINVNLPSDSELSKHVLQRWEGSFLGSSSRDVHFGEKLKENREMWVFSHFLKFQNSNKKVKTKIAPRS